MKLKYVITPILAFVALAYSSCGSSGNASTEPQKTEEAKDTATPAPEVVVSPYAKGQEVYNTTCKACHQENGEGLAGAFPPLAKSDYLLADKTRAIKQVITGSTGEITVNGVKFNGTMPAQTLSDEQIADVLNYVLHSWGNAGEEVKLEEVKSAH